MEVAGGHFWKVRFTTHPAGEGAGTGIAQGQGHLSRVGSLRAIFFPLSLWHLGSGAPWEWSTLGCSKHDII